MKKQKQLTLIQDDIKPFFGGELLRKKRKARRPLNSKKALHLVLRTRSFTRLRKHHGPIQKLFKNTALKTGATLYRLAVQSNHIHCIIKFTSRRDYVKFIRIVTGILALKLKGFESIKDEGDSLNASKSNSNSGASLTGEGLKDKTHKSEAFFAHRPFTRILEWGQDFKATSYYVVRNILEAAGEIPYLPRVDRYKRYRIKTVITSTA